METNFEWYTLAVQVNFFDDIQNSTLRLEASKPNRLDFDTTNLKVSHHVSSYHIAEKILILLCLPLFQRCNCLSCAVIRYPSRGKKPIFFYIRAKCHDIGGVTYPESGLSHNSCD